MIDVSVIIVNYNARRFISGCLDSVAIELSGLEHEIIVVDNHSTDGSAEMLSALSGPEFVFIENMDNVGFARANNQAITISRGRYILLLNNDTVVRPGGIRKLISYADEHPQVGAVGPKLLNRDLTFQPQCKRGFPTPWAAFTYFSGLSRLVPRSHLFGSYLLSYLDEDRPASVDALSGAAMLVRRDVVDRVGGLDEDFFMYGEDLDWCIRIHEHGWDIHYCPEAVIIHFKGQSGASNRRRVHTAFYESMRLFYDKHYLTVYPQWLTFLVHKGIRVLQCGGAKRKSGMTNVDH